MSARGKKSYQFVSVCNPRAGESSYLSPAHARRRVDSGAYQFTDSTQTWIVAVPEAQAYQRGVMQNHARQQEMEQRADSLIFGRLAFEWRARMSGGCAVMQAQSGYMAGP